MRKCQTCGYLLLGDGDTCKQCGALLPPSSAPALATPVLVTSGAPPAPPAPAAPPVPPPAPVFGAAAPPPTLPPSVARDYWGPPESPAGATASRKRPLALRVLIAVVSMALGWYAAGYFLHGQSLPPGTKAFVAGHGVSYSSPDHTFDASFPSAPTVERHEIPVASSSATMYLAQAETDDYEIVGASVVLPISLPAAQADAALDDIVKYGAGATDSEIVSKKRVVEDGVSGVEVRAKVADGYSAKLIVLISGRRIFLLGVHAKTGTDRLYKALVDSLVMY
jgi:hypothetical protein